MNAPNRASGSQQPRPRGGLHSGSFTGRSVREVETQWLRMIGPCWVVQAELEGRPSAQRGLRSIPNLRSRPRSECRHGHFWGWLFVTERCMRSDSVVGRRVSVASTPFCFGLDLRSGLWSAKAIYAARCCCWRTAARVHGRSRRGDCWARD